MTVRKLFLFLFFVSACFYCGCVERKLTIVTEPAGALVSLNDEEIGTSPVTVGFEWYGDYNIRLSKEGYITTSTHRSLQRPLRDRFPFDLLDDMFRTRTDEYSWNFKLEPYEAPDKEELIDRAISLRKEALVDPNAIVPKNTKKDKKKK